MTIGEKIREIYQERGMTELDIAIKSGLSENEIVRVITDNRKPKFSTLCKIAKALHVKPEVLMPSEWNELNDTVGGRIYKACARKCLNKQDLKNLTGLSWTAIKDITLNRREISLYNLFKIARVLDVKPEELWPEDSYAYKKLMDETTGGKIARGAAEKGFTIRGLATEIGVHEGTMARYIRNERIPSTKMLTSIAKVLKVKEDELIGN